MRMLYVGMLVGAIATLIGVTIAKIQADPKPCVTMVFQSAPHEQQPEPMMATAGVSVERWVL